MDGVTRMRVEILADKAALGRAAAADGAQQIREAIARQGAARIVVATAASQFEMLSELVQAPGIDWTRVTAFHLDEYLGLPITHPASFRLYLWQRFVSRLPLPLAAFHFIDGEGDAAAVCARLADAIRAAPVDVAFIGIGENGHLAFNDPPADFETTAPYLVVELDEACRRQQLGEGWFKSLADVPAHAISISVRQILASRTIVCSVPDRRKAPAVQGTLTGPVTPQLPASILQTHPATTIYLDPDSASLLNAP